MLSSKKEWNHITCQKIDETWDYSAMQNKPDGEC